MTEKPKDGPTSHSAYYAALSDKIPQGEKQFAPAAARNAGPITEVLMRHLPAEGRAIEIASGTGQHAIAFAAAFPGIDWTPSDPHPSARASIAAYAAESGCANLAPPRDIDVTAPDWWRAIEPGLAALVCINLVHISPWAATEGLLAGAGRLLRPGGKLCLYGPFRRAGFLAESNIAFDQSLRDRNPEWGVRSVEEVETAADPHGLALVEVAEMPANNLTLILRRGGG